MFKNLKIIFALFFCALFSKNISAKVIFTDVLYDNFKKGWGTTAIFDLDPTKGSIKDICGTVSSWYPGRAYDNHKGWDRDIPNDEGQYVIFAAAPGTIETAKDGCFDNDKSCNGGAGNYIVINHGEGITTHYFHARPGTLLVSQGQWVDRYSPLFIANNTGYSTGDHSHFEIRINGKSIDPFDKSVGWLVPPAIDLSKCPYTTNNQTAYYLVNPYILREYADDIINKSAVLYDPSEVGQISKDTYWLFFSNGADTEDIIIRLYQGGSVAKSIVFAFDLTGNSPRAFTIPSPVAEAWMGTVMSDGSLGKPITDQYAYSVGKFEVDFQYGYFIYSSTSTPTKYYYKDGFGPGMFENGWKAGKSYAVSECYRKNGARENVGEPKMKLTTFTSAVHEWEGYFVQDFSGGFYSDCAIMIHDLGSNQFKAHLMKGKIWSTYHSFGKGPSYFGAPISDEYKDIALSMKRQDFEKGMSILENGIAIWQNTGCVVDAKLMPPSPNQMCDCAGEIGFYSCGKCGKQKLVCSNYIWKESGICENQGVCAPGESEEKPCTISCGGTTKRACDNNCIWSEWSACEVKTSPEICDNIDNDCDSKTDEDLIQVCVSICGLGEQKCEGGKWSVCDAPNKNACDGCSSLSNQPGEKCGTNGVYECDGANNVKCKETYTNPCGGSTKLPYNPGDSCGTKCGHYECNGTDALKCVSEGICMPEQTQSCTSVCGSGKQICNSSCQWGLCDAPNKNACGGCSSLSNQPGEKCGTNGVYVCDGVDNVKCKETYTNPCGGTTKLPYNPSDPCGKCGHYECNGTDALKCVSEGICASGQTQSCTSVCGSGTQTCNSNCQWDSCSASGTGECTSGQTQTESCGGGNYCKQGTRTRTCNSCFWSPWSECSAANCYGFDPQTKCGDVICITIFQADCWNVKAKISKVNGQTFTSNPIEWFIMDKTLNKVLAHAPGFGCDTYYSGQKEIIVTFDPAQYNITLDAIQAEVYSGGTFCEKQYLSDTTYIQKCK